MEVAENDDGFASCDEEDENGVKRKSSKGRKKTGDPFKDYELELAEVENQEAIGKLP